MEWYGMIMESTWSVPYGFHTLFHDFHGLHGLPGFQMEWCVNSTLLFQLEVM